LKNDANESLFEGLNGDGFGDTFFGFDSADEWRSILHVEHAIDLHEVFFFDFGRGVGETMCEVAAVAEDEQAFGLAVEATDMIEMFEFSRYEVENGLPPFGIIASADEVRRFVESDGHLALGGDQLAIDSDFVSGLDAVSEIPDLPVVDGDATLVDDRFTRAPRA